MSHDYKESVNKICEKPKTIFSTFNIRSVFTNCLYNNQSIDGVSVRKYILRGLPTIRANTNNHKILGYVYDILFYECLQ